MAFTKQEIFDKAVIGVLSQNNYAVETRAENRTCKLRTKSGNRCAFGQLIDKEIYEPDMEDLSSLQDGDNEIFLNFPKLNFLKRNMNILQQLQEWHDNASAVMPDEFFKSRNKRIKFMFSTEALQAVVDIARRNKLTLKNINAYITSRGYPTIGGARCNS